MTEEKVDLLTRVPPYLREKATKKAEMEGYSSRNKYLRDVLEDLTDDVPTGSDYKKQELEQKRKDLKEEKKEVRRDIRELEHERDEKVDRLDEIESEIDDIDSELEQVGEDEFDANTVDEIIADLAEIAEEEPVTYEHEMVVYAKNEFDLNPVQAVLGPLYERHVHIPEEHIPDVVPSQYERQYDGVEHAKNEIVRVYDAGDEDRARVMAKEAARKLDVKPSKVREAVEEEVGEDALTPDYLLN